MTVKNAALATTAIISISATAALANGNGIYLVQDGSANEALIDQDGAPGSQLGSDVLTARQIGDANQMLLSQIGGNNLVGLEGDGIVQEGNNNFMDLTQRGYSNAVGSVVQRGDGNRLVTFSYVDGDNNRIGSVLQDSLGSGGFNQLHYGVHGSNNGYGSFTGDAAEVGIAENAFVQIGGMNNIDLQVTGENNLVSGSQIGGGASMFYYWVNGVDNQTALSIEAESGNNILGLTLDGGAGNNVGMRMRTTGSIGNYAAFYLPGAGASYNTMFADQMGDDNSIVANTSGSFSDIDMVQIGTNNETVNHLTGDYNTLSVVQDGVNNVFRSEVHGGGTNAVFTQQVGSDNSSYLDVNGMGNNTLGAPLANGATMFDTPMFSGVAGEAANVAGLSSGALMQSGTGNTMDVDIGTNGVASYNNLFAIVQSGMNNSATVNVSGDNNQAAISQSGDYNVASVTQMGNGNVVGVLQ